MSACLVMCVLLGFHVHTNQTHTRARSAVVEATRPSREPSALARGEQTCCRAEAMRDVPPRVGVGKVEHAGENLCMCMSERMSIWPVHVQVEHGP